jgi:hypothetical protein
MDLGPRYRDNRTELDQFSTARCIEFNKELICDQSIDHPLPHTRIHVINGHWVISEWTTRNSTVMERDLNSGAVISHS